MLTYSGKSTRLGIHYVIFATYGIRLVFIIKQARAPDYLIVICKVIYLDAFDILFDGPWKKLVIN